MRAGTWCLPAVVLAAQGAAGAASYQFKADVGPVVGNAATVTLYLQETGGTQIAAEGGLQSIGYQIARQQGGGTISGFTPNTAPAPLGFPAVVNNSFGATGASFYGEIDFAATSGPSPTAGLLNLGTLSVTLTDAAPTQFSFGDFGAGNQTVTVNGTGSLDATIASTTFTVVVPEPLAGTLGMAAGTLLLRRRRV